GRDEQGVALRRGRVPNGLLDRWRQRQSDLLRLSVDVEVGDAGLDGNRWWRLYRGCWSELDASLPVADPKPHCGRGVRPPAATPRTFAIWSLRQQRACGCLQLPIRLRGLRPLL